LRGSGRFPRQEAEKRVARLEFQSPSLRGSGRFGARVSPDKKKDKSFNPLHCGAVVAS